MNGRPSPSLEPGNSVPLVVDLDGTLVSTDTLFESALALIRKSPWLAFCMPFWLLRGRAVLKSRIGCRVSVDPENLPYRPELLAWLRVEHESGRTLVLATAAHKTIADAVAAHLAVFDEVLATGDTDNLKGPAKRDALIARFGKGGYDYVGDSSDDVPVWASSRLACLAGRKTALPGAALSAGAARGPAFPSPRPRPQAWQRALRPHQWVKNVLVFVPTLLNHRLDVPVLTNLIAAFFSFSFVASGTYIVNDLFDLEADRSHPRKSRRPFAAGELSIRQGVAAAVCLLAAGLGLGTAVVGVGLTLNLLAYMILTLAYSSFLKNKPILDVVTLAFLYTLRVFAGGIVASADISPWLFQFSIFLFLSLAMVKRYSELLRLKPVNDGNAPGRGYRRRDLNIISQAGVGSGLLAGLVLALYVDGQEVQHLYPRPQMLWFVCPIFVYWITRVWLIAQRGNMHEDPVLYAFRDRVSYIVGCVIVIAVLLGMIPHGR
jgi:4-hydroxybenzoate polyprenyltransferase